MTQVSRTGFGALPRVLAFRGENLGVDCNHVGAWGVLGLSPHNEKPSCGVDGKLRDALGISGQSAIARSRMRLLDEPGACFGRRGPLVFPAGGLDEGEALGSLPSVSRSSRSLPPRGPSPCFR
jgi:hypothetical protein